MRFLIICALFCVACEIDESTGPWVDSDSMVLEIGGDTDSGIDSDTGVDLDTETEGDNPCEKFEGPYTRYCNGDYLLEYKYFYSDGLCVYGFKVLEECADGCQWEPDTDDYCL